MEKHFEDDDTPGSDTDIDSAWEPEQPRLDTKSDN